jgi:ADP-heptose:LPS heptosyltransferase
VFYLSEQEKQWMSQVQELGGCETKFWVINAGYKDDYTAKKWTCRNYQEVVDHLWGKIMFVQVGELSTGHHHMPLVKCVNLIGKTDARQLLRLCWHSQGGLGGVSFLHHIFAALRKPFVCIASGMEPQHWERYQTERYLCKGQSVPCGRTGGCWKSQVVRDSARIDHQGKLCLLPIIGDDPVAKCTAMIRSGEVVAAVEDYYDGGVLAY